jgi:hypothetical protein
MVTSPPIYQVLCVGASTGNPRKGEGVKLRDRQPSCSSPLLHAQKPYARQPTFVLATALMPLSFIRDRPGRAPVA